MGGSTPDGLLGSLSARFEESSSLPSLLVVAYVVVEIKPVPITNMETIAVTITIKIVFCFMGFNTSGYLGL
jgi:hypothetical protein